MAERLRLLEQVPPRLHAWFTDQGLPPYRVRQVLQGVFRRRACQFDEMTDLPGALRDLLAEHFQIFTGRVTAHQKADDGSEKLLLELADGQQVECVLLRDDRRHCTACVSTQVGCAMGCAFCATGWMASPAI